MSAKSSSVDAFPDGTTDYKPLRAAGIKKESGPKKPHISELPMTWSNWYQHVNWLNTTFVVFIPMAGLIASYWVPLQLNTAIFTLIYYFNSGLGITAGKLRN